MKQKNNMLVSEDLSGEKKAAIVLLSLTHTNAATIMSTMDQEEILTLASAMSALGFVASDVVDAVLAKFAQEVQEGRSSIGNTGKATERILGNFLNKEELSALLAKIQVSVWKALEIVNPKTLAEYLSEENPQTVALICSKLEPSHVGAVLPFLEERFANAVMERIVHLKPVSKDILDQIEQCLKMELIVGVKDLGMKQDVAKQLALTLKNMSETDKNKYLDLLKEKHPEIAQNVEDLMFAFEDLTRIGMGGLNALLIAIDQGDLVLALRRVSAELQNFFFSNMPQRMVKMIQDEWDMMGKVKIKDIKNAQRKILEKAKTLIAEGKISLQSDNEEYV
jgi:flagellar motor switch protein FliG